MERRMLSDGAIQEILRQAMEDQFSKLRPATHHFFDHTTPSTDQDRPVTIHNWVIAGVDPLDSEEIIRHVANRAMQEVVLMAAALAGEVVFRSPRLLPRLPQWRDGTPLFAAHAPDGSDRFGVRGGNIVEASNRLSRDVYAAAERLADLDPTYERDERLQLFCAKPLERDLVRACAKAGVDCRVFGLRDHAWRCSWTLTRDSSACSLLIGQPSFEIPVEEENNLVIGARFVVWINNPRFAVCVTHRET
jgi:hypothetical protein